MSSLHHLGHSQPKLVLSPAQQKNHVSSVCYKFFVELLGVPSTLFSLPTVVQVLIGLLPNLPAILVQCPSPQWSEV